MVLLELAVWGLEFGAEGLKIQFWGPGVKMSQCGDGNEYDLFILETLGFWVVITGIWILGSYWRLYDSGWKIRILRVWCEGLGIKIWGLGFRANGSGPRGVMSSQYGDGNEYDLCRGVSHERGILVARWGCGVKG